MLITKIKLKNWKSHKESELSFDKGITIVIGNMGSGKSSILEAIAFSLFGSLANIGKLEHLIKDRPKKEDFARVELKFSQDNKEYLIIREIEKNKTNARLYVNGTLKESGSERVNSFIEDLLKIKSKTFMNVIYCEQNNLDLFFKLPPSQRKAKIDEILFIDVLEKVRENATTLSNRIKYIIEDKKIEIKEIDKEELIKERNEKEIELNEIKAKIIKNSSILSELKSEYEKIDKIIKEAEENIKILNEIKLEEKKLAGFIEQLSNEIESLNYELSGLKKDEIEENYKKWEAELENLKNESNNITKETENINKMLGSLEKEVEIKKDEIEKLKKELEELNKLKEKMKNIEAFYTQFPEKFLKDKEEKLKKHKEEKYKIIAEIKELESILETLKLTKTKCPICESDLSEEKKKNLILHREKHLFNIKSRLAEIEKNIKEIESQIPEIEKSVEMYKEIKKSLESLEEKEKNIENLKSEITMLNNKIFKAMEEREKLKNKKERIEENIKELESLAKKYEKKLEKFEELERKILYKEAKINEAKELIEKIKILESKIPPNIEELKKLSEIKRNEIHKIEIENEKLKGEGKVIEKNLEDLEIEIEKIEKIESEIKLLEKYFNFIQKFIKSLLLAQNDVRNYFITNSNYILSQVWRELYPYSKYTDIQVTYENDDYVIKIKDNFDRWYELSKCSGGEQTLANLCFRIALASFTAPNIKILLLDEPTHNLDEKAIEFLRNSLNSSLSKFVDQIILITHEESMQDIQSSITYRVESDELQESIVKRIK
ncbi:MAG: AAA family ATPase [Candidatus Aenigmatarchaeota archaeon]